jgi:hypothetical protein
MLRLLYELLWEVEQPPDRIGPIGFAIMAAFLLFCGIVLYFHPVPHP